ncbi:hypothetical protein VaNZ11_015508 [Volvox africanus]|uniref:Fibronectin type-III domain-containing protein n=1 Tax=Volvox africanus TaxID=51714 RepID=A0ABQ5SMF5_9CHLO|nr:hypothetical protein VaNZ11_015508 [Volvox africanus]
MAALIKDDPNLRLVQKVVSACKTIQSVPHGDLSERFITLMKSVDGVAQTFFKTKPAKTIMLNGPTVADATDIITTAAVIHVCKAIAQSRGLYDFDSTIKTPEAIAASDNNLGVSSKFGINLEKEATCNEKILERIFNGDVPVTITYEEAAAWTPSNNPTDGSPSHYLSNALLDDWIHTHLLQNIALLPNGWKDLTETPGFTASMTKYLSNRLNRTTLFNLAWDNSIPLQLILYILCRLDTVSYQQVSANIRGCALATHEEDPESLLPKRLYDTYHNFLGLIQGFTLNGSMIEVINNNPFHEPVKQVAMEQQATVYGANRQCFPAFPGVIPACSTAPSYTDITYGVELLKWLDRDGPASAKHYGLRTNARPNNMIRETHKSPGGCFVPGTLVLLANGTSIPIEEIKEGSKILCRNACNVRNWSRCVGIASSERVISISKSPFRVFGFNKKTPFFTAEHVFFTTTGLRALDPHMARAQNPWLEVGNLRLNDVVKRATEDGCYQLERIKHFTSSLVTGSVHGVHLREGLRSYHANGYLVYLNYPELTIDRMILGLRNLPVSQQLHFAKYIQGAKHIFGGVIGRFLPDAMDRAIATIASNNWLLMEKPKPEVLEQYGSKRHALHNLNTTFILKPHTPKGTTPAKLHPAGATCVALSRGHVFVNNELVRNARLIGDQVHWTRTVTVPGRTGRDEVHFEHGAIHLHPHRRAGYGRMMIMSTESATEDDDDDDRSYRSFRSAAVIPSAPVITDFTADATTIRYKTQVSLEPMPLSDLLRLEGKPGDGDLGSQVEKWIDGPTFLYGEGEESCKAQILGADGELLYMETFFETMDVNLSVHIIVHGEALRDHLKVPHQYKRMMATMSDDSMDFSGFVVKFDPSRPDYEGTTHYWKGQYIDDDEEYSESFDSGTSPSVESMALPMISSAPMPAMISSAPTQATVAPATPVSAFALGRSISEMDESRLSTAAPHPITRALSPIDEASSLKLLYGLSFPDSYSSQCATILKRAMHYHMDEKWNSTIFGLTKPTASELRTRSGELDLTAISGPQKDFLANKFGVAYISKMVSNSDRYAKEFTKAELQKIDFYLKGSGKDTMASDPNYTELSTIAQALAFRQLQPNLDAYVKSEKDWGEMFFNYLTKGPVGKSINNKLVYTSSGQKTIQKFCMTLYCLSKKNGTRWDNELYTKLGLYVPVKHLLPLSTIPADEITMQEFDNIFRIVVETLFNEELNGEVAHRLREHLTEFMTIESEINEEYKKDFSKVFMDKTSDLRKEALVYLASLRGPSWQRLRTWVNKISEDKFWLKKYSAKGLKIFGSILGASTYCASLYLTIKTMIDFNSLSPEEKASLINSLIRDVFSGIESIGPKSYEFLTGYSSKTGERLRPTTEPTGMPLEEVNTEELLVGELDDFVLVDRETAAGIAAAERALAQQEPMLVEKSANSIGIRIRQKVDAGKSWAAKKIGFNTSTPEEVAKTTANFRASAKVVRVVGTLTLLVSSVLSGIDIFKDIKDGLDTENQKLKLAMDSLQMASTSIMLGTELASFFVTEVMGEIFAMVTGPIGVVLGVAGFIVGLFMQAEKQEPPEDSIKTFISKTAKPFLQSLDYQSYPDPVPSVTAVLTDKNTASVTFSEPEYTGLTPLTFFTVAAFEVGPDAEIVSGLPTQIVEYPIREATVTGLKPGKTYSFHVTPSNGAQGDESNMAKKSTGSYPITVPMPG